VVGKRAVVNQGRFRVTLLIGALYFDILMIVVLDAVDQLRKTNSLKSKIAITPAGVNFFFVLTGLNDKRSCQDERNGKPEADGLIFRTGKSHVGSINKTKGPRNGYYPMPVFLRQLCRLCLEYTIR